MLALMQARTDGSFSTAVRQLVFHRARGGCERCGRGSGRWEWHHRFPRGMGGTTSAWVGSASNALLLCPPCHVWVERHRAVSVQQGWLVQYGDDPADVPVLVASGQRVLLSALGTYERQRPVLGVELSRGHVAASW